jgi:acylphosphatase
MKWLKKLRDHYVIWHAHRIPLPIFSPGSVIRKKVIFFGRVQRVGFRLEIYCLAERLALDGWVRNREDGSVETELQGEASKIDFLVHCMELLKRASVRQKMVEDLPVTKTNEGFRILQ